MGLSIDDVPLQMVGYPTNNESCSGGTTIYGYTKLHIAIPIHKTLIHIFNNMYTHIYIHIYIYIYLF